MLHCAKQQLFCSMMMPVQAPCQQQFPPVVAARRTVHSGTVSPAPRSRAAPLPAPRECDMWCLVCLWWRSCDKGGRCVVLQELRRACLQVHRITGAGRTAHRPFLQRTPPSTQRNPLTARDSHQFQQWCAGEGVGQRRWWMGAWSRGGSVRERVHASTHPFLLSRGCNIEAIVQNKCCRRQQLCLGQAYEASMACHKGWQAMDASRAGPLQEPTHALCTLLHRVCCTGHPTVRVPTSGSASTTLCPRHQVQSALGALTRGARRCAGQTRAARCSANS